MRSLGQARKSDEAIKAADSTFNVRTFIVGGILKSGSITDSFERGKELTLPVLLHVLRLGPRSFVGCV